MVCPAFHPITCPRRRTSSFDACAPRNRTRDSAAITMETIWRFLTRASPRCEGRLALGLIRAYQRQELIARLLVVAERSQPRARHRLPMLLLHASHLHAQVPRFNDHPHA